MPYPLGHEASDPPAPSKDCLSYALPRSLRLYAYIQPGQPNGTTHSSEPGALGLESDRGSQTFNLQDQVCFLVTGQPTVPCIPLSLEHLGSSPGAGRGPSTLQDQVDVLVTVVDTLCTSHWLCHRHRHTFDLGRT